jgi:hypothetical protein
MQHEYNVAVKLESKPMPPPTKKLTVATHLLITIKYQEVSKSSSWDYLFQIKNRGIE